MPAIRVLRSVAALAFLLACSEKEIFWTRSGGDATQFERTSSSCQRASEKLTEGDADKSTGFDSSRQRYRRDDPATNPNQENERRRHEQRVRLLYGQCMQDRGWVKNTTGEGFKGL